MSLYWTPSARRDRQRIYDYIGKESPASAIRMDEAFLKAAQALLAQPRSGRTGRMSGTREWVVHPNYILIYRLKDDDVHIVRLLHAAQKWPNPETS